MNAVSYFKSLEVSAKNVLRRTVVTVRKFVTGQMQSIPAQSWTFHNIVNILVGGGVPSGRVDDINFLKDTVTGYAGMEWDSLHALYVQADNNKVPSASDFELVNGVMQVKSSVTDLTALTSTVVGCFGSSTWNAVFNRVNDPITVEYDPKDGHIFFCQYNPTTSGNANMCVHHEVLFSNQL